MREILFQGKRKDNGEWIYGDLRQWSETGMGICGRDLKHTFPVRPETVGQFTGLTDKNGKRIFEGDIIKLSQSGKCYEVKYKSGCFCIGLNWAISHEPDCEVIGNIQDNPELLNGTES